MPRAAYLCAGGRRQHILQHVAPGLVQAVLHPGELERVLGGRLVLHCQDELGALAGHAAFGNVGGQAGGSGMRAWVNMAWRRKPRTCMWRTSCCRVGLSRVLVLVHLLLAPAPLLSTLAAVSIVGHVCNGQLGRACTRWQGSRGVGDVAPREHPPAQRPRAPAASSPSGSFHRRCVTARFCFWPPMCALVTRCPAPVTTDSAVSGISSPAVNSIESPTAKRIGSMRSVAGICRAQWRRQQRRQGHTQRNQLAHVLWAHRRST